MQKRDKYTNHYRIRSIHEIEAQHGDVWYKLLKFINSLKKGEIFTDITINKMFKNHKATYIVWEYMHDIRAAGYIEYFNTKTTVSSFRKLHDIPYHISRSKFYRNGKGKMLWIESEVVFKKE